LTGPHPAAHDESREQVIERLLQILREHIRARSDEAIQPFLNRIMALPEAGMRSSVVAERLRGYDAQLSLALLTSLVEGASRSDPRAKQLLLDLCTARPLATILGYDNSRRVYELAIARGEEQITQLFLFSENTSALQPGAAFLKRENNKLPDESLGWRKKCARGQDRLKLDRLLFDRNPSVVRLLLENPRIVERDVVKIAAMRPANPKCLHEVFTSSRWIPRYQVKVALACNPYTPVDIAMACVPHLMLPRLKYLEGNSTIHPSTRACARDILRKRGVNLSNRRPRDGREDDERERQDSNAFVVDLERIARELENWRADDMEREGDDPNCDELG